MTFRRQKYASDCQRRGSAVLLTLFVGLVAAGTATGQLAPGIAFITPTSVEAGSSSFILNVVGSNFSPSAVVLWNGNPLQTVFRSPNEVAATVPAALVATPGTASVLVRNPDGLSTLPRPFTITGLVAPVITPAALPGATVGTAYSFTFTATGGSLPYTWTAEGLPPGLALSTGGVLSGIPTSAGTFAIRVRVTDANSASGNATGQIIVARPPFSVATTSPLPPATVGQAYSVTLEAAGGVAPVRWAIIAGTVPAGLTLNPTTGVLSGTPTIPGNFEFAAQATDSTQAVATRALALRVNPAPLEITTIPPLFNGTVGLPYSQTFTAAGGVPPYRWGIRGQTGGLSFDTGTGTLFGTPTSAGTLSFTIDVTDTAGATASKDFTVTIVAQAPVITTASPLPPATVGAPYSVTLAAVRVAPPERWTIVAGGLPGLTLDPATGVLTYSVSIPGTFTFTVEVRGSDGGSATKAFSLTVNPAPLTIPGGSQTFTAQLGATFTQILTASGGLPPYVWSANGLPAGLQMEPDGTVTGAPTVAGVFSFTARVVDASRAASTELYRLNIGLPPLPAVDFPGVPGSAEPAVQLTPAVRIAGPYPADLTGELLLSLTPDSGSGDATVQFSTGGRSVSFRIPAGSTSAIFPVPDLTFQTGTVAGVITLTARMQAFGIDATPVNAPNRQIRIERAAPVITATRFTRGSGTIDVEVTGYCTAREVTQAVFRFRNSGTGELQTPEVSLPVESLFATWFQDPASARFGSQFKFTQRFNVQGDVNTVELRSVTLTNRIGSTTRE